MKVEGRKSAYNSSWTMQSRGARLFRQSRETRSCKQSLTDQASPVETQEPVLGEPFSWELITTCNYWQICGLERQKKNRKNCRKEDRAKCFVSAQLGRTSKLRLRQGETTKTFSNTAAGCAKCQPLPLWICWWKWDMVSAHPAVPIKWVKHGMVEMKQPSLRTLIGSTINCTPV